MNGFGKWYRFSLFTFFHLLYKQFHGGFGDQIDLLSNGCDWKDSFTCNRRIVKPYQFVCVREITIFLKNKIKKHIGIGIICKKDTFLFISIFFIVKYSRTDRIILGIAYVFLGVFVLSILIPLIYVVLASFMDPTVLNNQGLSFHIKDWTLDAYRRVLENDMIWRGFLNSFLYSIAFTVISVFVTLLAAYPMSKKEFVGRKFFNIIFLITMFFGGGMIPTFILINQLHMVNTIWAILIPGAFNVWNMILARTYYQSIPKELREASAIDGATEIQHFFKVMLPVCKPIIAVLALWSFVGMWNSYFDAMIYLNDANLQPLQLVLRSILVQNTPQPGMIADIQSTAEMAKVAEQLKYATIVVSSLPLLVMYPFFQKYFDKGIMVGSVKG